MSYTYKFGDSGLAGFKNLDFWLQEEVLDEMDRVTAIIRVCLSREFEVGRFTISSVPVKGSSTTFS